MSMAVFKEEELKVLGDICLRIFSLFGLTRVKRFSGDDEVQMVECNNLTLINLILKMFGPMHERTLTLVLLTIQIFCSAIAFAIRYPLAFLLFGEVRA